MMKTHTAVGDNKVYSFK